MNMEVVAECGEQAYMKRVRVPECLLRSSECSLPTAVMVTKSLTKLLLYCLHDPFVTVVLTTLLRYKL
jgi:hypothetical protein